MSNDIEKKMNAISLLAENYGKEMSVDFMKFWLLLLQPYTSELVQKAVIRVISEYFYKTIPPFAVIKNAIDAIQGNDAKTTSVLALSEWGKLLETIESCGSYRVPTLNTTTAHVVKLMGGWGCVCSWRERDLYFKEKRFLELWEEAHGKEELLGLGADDARKLIRRRGGLASIRNILDDQKAIAVAV